MRDFSELIARLKQSDDNCNAECCECSGECLSSGCNIFSEAADAIEELLAERDQYKAYFDNVSSLPDCNVCLKQSVCEFVPAWGENTRINCPLALTEPPKEETE